MTITRTLSRIAVARALGLTTLTASAPAAVDPNLSWDDRLWLPGLNGEVNAAAVIGTDLYIGGNFTTVNGVLANHVARWDGSSWTALGDGVSGGNVYTMTAVGTDLYVGGSFSTAGGASASHIAKWDGTAWSALGLGTSSPVHALTGIGGDLYAGGGFTTAGGVIVNNIAKWNGTAWSALGNGTNGEVRALTASGATLYAGGMFTNADGVVANRIARWSGTWSAVGTGFNGDVRALAASGSDIYATGDFTTAGGGGANRIAKWNGSSWSALGSGLNVFGSALVVSGSDVYVGGGLTTAGGSPAQRIAKWNGSTWSALGAGMNTVVNALALIGTDLYAGGNFITAGGNSIRYLARWDTASWSNVGVLTTGLGAADTTNAAVVIGSDVYVAGNTEIANGISYLAKWDGSTWSALGSGVDSSVYALATDGTNLYAGGTFSTAGGNSALRVARWDGSSWSALGSGIDGGDVYALAVHNGDLYAGGGFTTAGGNSAISIAKWDGGTWSPLGSGIPPQHVAAAAVRALAVFGGHLHAGGRFVTAGGVSANHIAKWDGTSWSALGSGISSFSTSDVVALAVSGSYLYAGGSFTHAGGNIAVNLARWDGTAWFDGGFIFNGPVEALLPVGDAIYVGGLFTSPASRIVKRTGGSWIALGAGIDTAGPGFGVRDLVRVGDDVVAVGGFKLAGNKPSVNFAIWHPQCGNALTDIGEACDDGNAVEGDGCDTNCTVSACGNGIQAGAEQCDDGNPNDDDGCDSNCTPTGCGNGIVTSGETCDDGNASQNDGCTNSCIPNVCGDGFPNIGVEECDDGNASNTDACTTACLANVCGDGNTYIGVEDCDDANMVNGDGCDNTCTFTGCGNGIVTGGETCDDGNLVNGDACDNNCQPSRCGNGAQSFGRQCNAVASDGLSCAEECDSAWTSPFSAGVFDVQSVAVVSGKVVAGGSFDAGGGGVANNIAVWSGSAWSPLGAGVDGEVYAIASSGNTIYAGGDFLNAGGAPAANIAKWNGSAWSALGAGTDGAVRALVLNGTDLYAAGDFTMAGGMGASYVAKWNGSAWSALGAGLDDGVNVLARIGSDVYAGGRFSMAGGNAASRVARWDGVSWSALGAGLPDEVYALAIIGTDLYAGGAGYLMKWDGANWTSILSGGFEVYAMVAAGSELIVAGSFRSDPNLGVPADSIARWDGANWYALGSGIDQDAIALAWDGVRVHAAGFFETAGGKPSATAMATWTYTKCGEQCDDGNAVNGDGCDANCTVSVCGNGILAGGEVCDDGNKVNGDACDNNCTLPACGNGVASPSTGEQCDDGNAVNGDGCESNCRITPVSQPVTAGGTVSTGATATPEQPVQLGIMSPNAGTVTIVPPPVAQELQGFAVVGVQLEITAPPATVNDPLVIVVTVEESLIPEGVGPSQLTMTRDGVLIGDCAEPDGTATPDPCIESRNILGDGDVELTVLTSHASLWSVVVRGMNKDEQKCLNGMNGSGVKVAKAQAKRNATCLKNAAKGDELDAQGCLEADAAGKVDKEVAKTADKAADTCGGGTPFGFTGAGTVNAAARQSQLALMSSLFSTDLTGAAIDSSVDPSGAKCQAAALKAVQNLFNTHATLFLKCKKSGLAGKRAPLMVSDAQLAGCFDQLAADADDKIAKKVVKLHDTLVGKCEEEGVALATALPGTCSGTASQVTQCLGGHVACRVCRMFNAMDGLAQSCDSFDDGQLNGSCN